MNWKTGLRQKGVLAALSAALLFGIGTPIAKLMLEAIGPWVMAGLLYLGSGLGLTLYRMLTHAPAGRLPRSELPWLVGAIVAGGLVGPVLLMLGLTRMPASGASLLLNAEGVFTALLAWFAFRETFDRRIALGMLAIVAGAVILSWPDNPRFSGLWPALAILGACLAWSIDNNLTRRVSLADATWIASVKGLAAGVVNLGLAYAMGMSLPSGAHIGGAMFLGLLAYGVSLSLFVVALRHLGTARTGAYFSVAPYFGAALALLLGDPLSPQLVLAAALMAMGLWLHLTEHHEHEHVHERMTHSHRHIHDSHHQHAHGTDWDGQEPHEHVHHHPRLVHSHAHYPDIHHRH